MFSFIMSCLHFKSNILKGKLTEITPGTFCKLLFIYINCRFNGRKYPFTEFVIIKSPIDAVKFSNTIQLSSNLIVSTQKCIKIYTVLKIKIWISWCESNSRIYFYIFLNKN